MHHTPRSLLLPIGFFIAACSGGSGAADPDAGPQQDASSRDGAPAVDASPGGIPYVEESACRFDVPASLGLSEGSDYACGDLLVYENRDNPGRVIRVHFVRFFSEAESNNATIYFEGGPGGNGSGMVARLGYVGGSYLQDLMVDGDFIVIAQRGTTLSSPSLDCDSVFACSQLSDDLSAYNSAYNADDVDELRSSLHYDKLNIYGISYGSRLALEVLRRHGEHIRSATIGGLVPSQIIWPAGVPAAFYGALTALNNSCSDDGACGTAFGDLRSDFIAGVQALDANPVSLDGGNIFLDGYTYSALLFQLMYARSSYPWLPMAISDLANRQTDRVESFLVDALYASSNVSIATGMYYAVVCGEMFSPPNQAAFVSMNAQVPSDIRDIYSGGWFSTLDTCSSWPSGSMQAALAEPVTSSVPTFVASGAMDPITPPSYGAAAADYLSDSIVVTFANSGHGSTVQTECGRQSFLAFLANPDTNMDVSCAAALTTDYVLPSVAPVATISRQALTLELQQALVPPELSHALRGAFRK